MQLNVRVKSTQRPVTTIAQHTLMENETLTIEYKSDSKPNTLFIWTKDSSVVLNDLIINIKQKNEIFILYIY